ncbi:Predicted phosphohydrolase, Cof family, HAD superfamily [Paenibacillus sp. UNC496MF]|uniref:HAD family hydrolase n=1 Tax=Paenibacillus sp. UNC496MF TaxID=1502753 RepID=UPI0008F04902|nr:HAD family hydrolase [Paenibacillus sp. UNC496MF]SFJ65342.1 Predicted phosphohydrolase, Cof family, HAD superfamily [Paenibacillus sp. UNC496MF]
MSELIQAYTASMDERGLDLAFNQVKAFHQAFNHPVASRPTMMEQARAENRMHWCQEEIQEFLDSDNVVDQADAMIDLMYFALGTLVELGVKPQALMDIVQHANMSKLWPDGKPHYREGDGKIQKPAGWEDPYPKLKAAIESM